MSKTIENIKSGNYEIVDNRGVSVTRHFIECLEKEFADLEAKLAKNKKWLASNEGFLENQKLKQQLAEKEKEIIKLNKRIENQVDNGYKIVQNCKKLQIEQLEKAKELLYPELRFDYSLYLRVMHEIDNQIKQLKEGK